MKAATHPPFFWKRLAAVGIAGFLLGLAAVYWNPGMFALEPRKATAAAAAGAPRELPVPRWHTLASDDVGTFAANLRAIGCPEETIARVLDRETGRAPAVAPVPITRPTPATALPIAKVEPPVPTEEAAVIVAPEGNVALPVAFQPLPQDIKMTDVQRAQLNAIQERFVRDIGGDGQDPSSEDYKEQWRTAQRRSDAQFRAIFGQEAFVRRQMATVRADHDGTPPVSPP